MQMEEYFLNEWRETWLKFVLNIHKKHDAKNEDAIEHIANNGNVTMDMIEKYIECDWYFIAKNPHLTMDYILAHPEADWDWTTLCEHKNITLDMILAHPEMCDYPKHVVRNPNVTVEMLKTHHYFTTEMPKIIPNPMYDDEPVFSRGWSFADVALNPNITMKNLVELFGEINHSWFGVTDSMSEMQHLDLNHVFANPTLKWNIYKIIENPRIGKHLTDEDIHALSNCGILEDRKTFEILWLCKICMHSTMYELKNIQLKRNKENKFTLAMNALASNDDLTMGNIKMNMTTLKNFTRIYKNELPNERRGYIWNKMICMLLVTMYEQNSLIVHETLIEWVIADEYILSRICVF
jgi:hypothetical protein